MEAINRHAIKWIYEAGQVIREAMSQPLTIDTKSNRNDLVTSMDRNIEQFFAERIRATYSDHLIYGEEGYGDEVTSLQGIVWLIDPIDGTMNFVHQKQHFCISIGIYKDGIGEIGLIYDVVADILYKAMRGKGAYKNDKRLPNLTKEQALEDSLIGMNHHWLCDNRIADKAAMQQLVKTVRGTRTYGSAALEFAYVSEGILDGYMALGLSGWDVAAGMVLVSEVGGMTTDIDGSTVDLLSKNAILVCNSAVRTRLMEEFIKPGRKME
ncbi:inositol monophosphatase family protein [Lentibacillus saliphilus]|uniref:inositol monophosphatase family protein n=1 Tax=Lentibacillus saliphilus TaxID=2737028 RepID=UPI001C30B539|nr:inositol monophosphatase family protein [Lentibacillus saliphilus]